MEKLPEVEYKKEADGKAYLLLQKTKTTYEEQMIRKALPSGVLPMTKSERENCYKYEITGRKNLALTFERVPMNSEQVRKVLLGIFNVLEGAREYLLGEEHFILQPEYIYLRIPEYEVTLCYYPEYNVPFSEQMGKLFEMLLNRVDYREEKAIALVYALYMQLQEPDMTLERIKKKLEEQGQVPEMVKPLERVNDTVSNQGQTGRRGSTDRENVWDNERLFEGVKKRKPSLLERLRRDGGFLRSFVPVKKTMSEEKASEGQVQMLGEDLRSPAYVMDAAPEWGMQHTRVISLKKDTVCPMLVSEVSGENIELTKFPFYIGSLSGYADGVIANDTISRFHAKLQRQDEGVFLMDLNSTNGTKVNGRFLNVQESVKLSSGDCISFAESDYYYFEE